MFFGLFAEPGAKPHHRIFGYLQVDDRIELGSAPGIERQPEGFSLPHPHVLGRWAENNCLYVGPGRAAQQASPTLRLTAPGESPSVWELPAWVGSGGLTYHGDAKRWLSPTRLKSVGRGQEFVCSVLNLAEEQRREARRWVQAVLEEIEKPSVGYNAVASSPVGSCGKFDENAQVF